MLKMVSHQEKNMDSEIQLLEMKFVSRSDIGYEKYGSTLDDERRLKMKGLTKYLNDIQEELMDAVLYIQAAREELRDLSEEAMIDKFKYDEEKI